ncbi:carboxypeptidase regulatory-like domain-containing protein [bacterium]|nr:carboxypeptidase regulatory-like domain-containing protein [bacterium]
MNFRHFLLFIVIICFFSCSNSSVNPDVNKYIIVSGTVHFADSPIQNASVVLEGPNQYIGLSNNLGKFEFNQVKPGSYEIAIQYQEPVKGLSRVELSKELENDTNFGNLILPQIVHFLEPNISNDTALGLVWTKSVEPGFKRYGLYRHNNESFIARDGELLFMSESLDDTLYVDSWPNSSSIYFYRVVAEYDDHGITESNIIYWIIN